MDTNLERLNEMAKGNTDAIPKTGEGILMMWYDVDGSFIKASYQDKDITEQAAARINAEFRIEIEYVEEGM